MQQKLIQYNFNASAKTYLKYAQIQKIAALKIIQKLSEYPIDGFVLDLGSGPGTMRHGSDNLYKTILYDLSIKTLEFGLSDMVQENIYAINGDANFLPFATGSIATVISNLMLQWPDAKLQILGEIKRVLARRGIFMFTTLITPSLWQLKSAWSKLDCFAHTLDFLSYAQYTDLVGQCGFKIIHSETWEEIVSFTDIHSLMWHFKLTGTTLPKTNMGGGLGGGRFFKELEIAYPKDMPTNTLPLSYQYLFMVAKHDE